MADSIGIDIVEKKRIARMFTQYGNRFVRRLLSHAESDLLEKRADKVSFLAGRFAAKEAAVKALGPYLSSRPAWSELEIIPDRNDIPRLCFPSDISTALPNLICLVSISHERNYAVAMAVFTEKT